MSDSTLNASAEYRFVNETYEFHWFIVLKFGAMEIGEIQWKFSGRDSGPNQAEIDLAVANLLTERLFK